MAMSTVLVPISDMHSMLSGQEPRAIFEATKATRGTLEDCTRVEALMACEWAENRLLDFNLWAAGLGASSSSGACLDARLASQPAVRTVVLGLLSSLNTFAQDCIEFESGSSTILDQYLPTGDDDGFHGDQPSDSESDPFAPGSDQSSSDSINSDQSQSPYSPLEQAMADTESILDQLIRLGMAIKRAGTGSRLRKADANFTTQDYKHLNDDNYKHSHKIDVENLRELKTHLLALIFAHPSQLERENPQDGGSHWNVSSSLAKLEEAHRRTIELLVFANLLRRNRFSYASRHAEKLARLEEARDLRDDTNAMDSTEEPTDNQDHVPDQGINEDEGSSSAEVPNPTTEKNPTAELPPQRVMSDTAPSEGTVDKRALEQMAQSQRSLSRKSVSLKKSGWPHPPPAAQMQSLFKCPCCHQILAKRESELMRWRNHLSHDLSPFTCIFPDCSMDIPLFISRNAWKNHLQQEHRSSKYWECFACTNAETSEIFHDEGEFTAHMNSRHGDAIPQSTISTLLKACERTTPIAIKACPLCVMKPHDGDLDPETLLDHIADHIHNFSLSSLPWMNTPPETTVPTGRATHRKVKAWLKENTIPDVEDDEEPKDDNERNKLFLDYFAESAATSSGSKSSMATRSSIGKPVQTRDGATVYNDYLLASYNLDQVTSTATGLVEIWAAAAAAAVDIVGSTELSTQLATLQRRLLSIKPTVSLLDNFKVDDEFTDCLRRLGTIIQGLVSDGIDHIDSTSALGVELAISQELESLEALMELMEKHPKAESSPLTSTNVERAPSQNQQSLSQDDHGLPNTDSQGSWHTTEEATLSDDSEVDLTGLEPPQGLNREFLERVRVDFNDQNMGLEHPALTTANTAQAPDHMLNTIARLLLGTEVLDFDTTVAIADKGEEAFTKLLLDEDKIDWDAKASNGVTPLALAAYHGFETITKLLLDTGKVDPDVADYNGNRPLAIAARNGHEAIVKMLLSTGKVDLDARDSYGRTPLALAAEDGHETIFKMLLDTGEVDLDARDENGYTPLLISTKKGRVTIVKMLLDTGKVDLEAVGPTFSDRPLLLAVQNANNALVKMLLGTGKVNPNVRDEKARTPLAIAAENGHGTIVKMLLDTNEVDLNANNTREETPLFLAVRYGHEAVVKMLLDTNKVDIDAKNVFRDTPRSLATKSGNQEIVRMLLDAGKNPEINHDERILDGQDAPPPKSSVPTRGRADSLSTPKPSREIHDELKAESTKMSDAERMRRIRELMEKEDAQREADKQEERKKYEAELERYIRETKEKEDAQRETAEEEHRKKLEAEKAAEPAKSEPSKESKEDEMERITREIEEKEVARREATEEDYRKKLEADMERMVREFKEKVDAQRETTEEEHRKKREAEKGAAKVQAEEDSKRNANPPVQGKEQSRISEREAVVAASSTQHRPLEDSEIRPEIVDTESHQLSNSGAATSTRSLSRRLRMVLVESPLDGSEFIPVSDLDNLITRSNIAALLSFRKRIFRPSLRDEIFRHGRKLMAILVLMDNTPAINSMIQEGLTDEDLPLPGLRDMDGRVVINHGAREFKCFETWDLARVEEFFSKQWRVLAPVFDSPGQHFDLHQSCPLPIMEYNRVADSSLYMGLIHPAHYRGHDENGSGHAVAIKDFSHGTLRVFKREKEYLQRIRSLSSRHVMKAIATCTRGSSYYIFFPWATGGNLKDFWKLETTRRTRLPTRWSLNQMLGIATALQSLNIFGDEYQDFEPKDILHFRGKGVETGTLVLRVTATSKFTPMYARGSRNQPRITWYRAPELRPLPRFTRRRHNSIWSMGCILLEHVIWLLYGHKILVQFKASWRLEDLGNDPNKFYTRDTQEMETISLDGGIRRAVDPSPKVLVRVIYGMLKKDANCREGTMLGDLVNLIFQDLLILPGRHEGYEKFVTKLREIKERADRAPSYLCTEFDDVVAKQGFIDSLPEAGEKDFMIADW